MIGRIILLIVSALLVHSTAMAGNYTWTGATNTAWNTSTNWSPNGLPGTNDTVTIVNVANSPVLDMSRTVKKLTMTSGTLNLNSFILTISASSSFIGGTVNNGTIRPQGNSAVFSGTTFGAGVTANCSDIYLNGSVFNATASITKSGASDNIGLGGNTFNGTATIVNSGSGDLTLASVNPDVFNATTNVTISNTGYINMADSSPGNQFNGNLRLNSSSSGYINFGLNGGTSVMASGRSVNEGSSGFTAGNVVFYEFSQSGTSSNSIDASGTSSLTLVNCTFGGGFTSTTDQLYVVESTFNGIVNFTASQIYPQSSVFAKRATLTQIGSGSNNIASTGGNTFQDSTIFKNTGTGTFNTGYTVNTPAQGPDIFNGPLSVVNTNTGTINIGHNTSGNQFNGRIYIGQSAAGTIQFGWIGGTSTLASGKTISASTSGFSAGNLGIVGMTQVGNTPQQIIGTGSAGIGLFSCEFNGRFKTESNYLSLSNNMFKNVSDFKINISYNHISAGGNTFSDSTYMTASGTGEFILGTSAEDTFEGPVTFTCETAGSGITVAWGATTLPTVFYDNIFVNLLGDGRVKFSYPTTLVAGKTISEGSKGAHSGLLQLVNFTQEGSTSQTIDFTGSARLYIEHSTFNGNVDFTAGGFNFDNAEFKGTSNFTKISSLSEDCHGNNHFRKTAVFNLTGTGNLTMGHNADDTFHEGVTFNRTNSGMLRFAHIYDVVFYGDVTVNGDVEFGANGGNAVFSGNTIQTIYGDDVVEFHNLKIDKTGAEVVLDTIVSVEDELILTSRNIISSASDYLRLEDGIAVTGASGTSFVDGPVRKVGNDAFTFPVGKGSVYQPVGISAPFSVSDAFTAEYFHAAPPAFIANNYLSSLSDCQYWNVSRDNGTSDVSVSLIWSSSTCTAIDPNGVKVARYTGSQWENEGGNDLTGNSSSGSITSDVLSAYGIVTFGADLCGGYTTTTPLLHVTSPANFTILDSISATDSFQWNIDVVPGLNGQTEAEHTVIVQVAEWEADPVTGAIPYWGNKIEFTLPYDPNTNALVTGPYAKLMEDLIGQQDQEKSYFWRVGLRYLPELSGVQPVSWSDIHVLTVRGKEKAIPAAYLADTHTNDINWVYEVTYLDENKTNEVISYIDGLGKTRQNQVLLNSSSVVMGTEVAYSEEGGGTVQSMVAPTGASAFGYAHRFFDVKDGSNYSDFTTAHFDREVVGASFNTVMTPVAVDTTAGVGDYYRNNSTYESYVDDARGYPYAYSVTYKDPLNRPMLTGGVGETFKITGGKEIQSFNTSPSYDELKRIYGRDKADSLSNISKSITLDPNGVGSITYTDAEGKVIATALTTCGTVSANLDELAEDGKEDFTARYNILKNDVLNADDLNKTSSSNFFLSCPGNPVDLHYQIDQGVFTTGLSTCKNCKLELNIRIVEDATGYEVMNKTKLLPTDTTQITCGATPQTYSYDTTITMARAGTYTVYRSLAPQKNVSGKTVVEQAIYDYTQLLHSKTDSLRNNFEAEYYGRDEWYMMRRFESQDGRVPELGKCLELYAGQYWNDSIKDGNLQTARLGYGSSDIIVDNSGNIYFINVLDRIRKISPSGEVSTLYINTSNSIQDIAVDDSLNLYFIDWSNIIWKLKSGASLPTVFYNLKASIRTIEYANGVIYFSHASDTLPSTMSNLSVLDLNGDLLIDGILPDTSELPFSTGYLATGLIVNGKLHEEEIYVASTTAVFRINTDRTYTQIAGVDGQSAYVDGNGTQARFRSIRDITSDKANNIYLIDELGRTVRKITNQGTVSTYAGSITQAGFNDGPIDSLITFFSPLCLAFDLQNNLLITDRNSIRRISTCGRSSSSCPEVLPEAQLTFSANPPQKLVLQPWARDGKDAMVYTSFPNNNYGNFVYNLASKNVGSLEHQSLLEFNLDSLPVNSYILNAKLSLYADPYGHSGTGHNGLLERMIQAWDENVVTWNTKPATTTINKVSLPVITNINQNCSNIDVTDLVKDMRIYGNHGFILSSSGSNTLLFASSDHPIASIRPKLELTYVTDSSTCSNLGTLNDYATITLNLVPHSDTSASAVAIGQATWDNGMEAEDFVSALVASVNSNYNNNDKGFIAWNNIPGQPGDKLHVSAAPGTGNDYNRWKLTATVSYTSGLDTSCFKVGINKELGQGAFVTSAPNVFKGGFDNGQCTEDRWYLDQVSLNDVTIDEVAKKEIVDLDGMTSDPAFKEKYIIDGLGTPANASSAIRDYFREAYERLHWVNIKEEDILSIQTYPVTGSSNLTIPAILDNRHLDDASLQDYVLVKIRYKAPSCEDQCIAKEWPVDCNKSCDEKLQALDAYIFEVYDSISRHTFGAFTAPGSMHYVDLNNTPRSLKYLVDTYHPWSDDLMHKVDSIHHGGLDLYMSYVSAMDERRVFDKNACMRICSGGTGQEEICQTCRVTYNGCVYEHQTQLSAGYDYLMDAWDAKGFFPFTSLSELQTAIAGTDPVEYKPVTDVRDALGMLLYDYIVENFATIDQVKANWETTGGACSNCGPPANSTYGCSAGVAPDLTNFPSKLIPILNAASASCQTEYEDCLLQANDSDLFMCLQNRSYCLEYAENSTDSTACTVKFNCTVSTAGTDSLQRMQLIRETVAELYINSDTIKARSEELYAETLPLKLPELPEFLMNYESEQRCRLQCANYLDVAFSQWLENKIDSATAFITSNYTIQCYNMGEQMEVSYEQSLYHYTLYDYNMAGQLIATVPPEGIDYVNIADPDTNKANRTPNHRMKTLYTSNSLGQLNKFYTPDGDSTRYLYDKAGRVRFSQTQEQKARGAAATRLIFSYTIYDQETGRILEVGEYNHAPDTIVALFSPADGINGPYVSAMVDQLAWPDDDTRTTDESNFYYDQPYLSLTGYDQQNLHQRVSRVCNANACTYYSYDKHGRVNFVAQELLNMQASAGRFKTVDYRYLPVTSQVQQVIYQKGNDKEEFRHRYSYDNDNRLTLVEVSRDTVSWSKAAAYDYYLHGPLKSTGLGDSIQKMDYVYNLQGWLKAINHPVTAHDPGQDDIDYARDVFGMALHYYSGDYKRLGKQLDATAAITPKSGSHIKDKGKDLYNGNISAWTTYTGFDQTGTSTADPMMGQGFRYDKLNRLTGSFVETMTTESFTAWTANSISRPNIYQENLKYDANGNIDTLIRTSGNVSTAMDNMFYRYTNTVTDYYGRSKKANNNLEYIDDDTDVSAIEDITDQDEGNYVYDAKGRLIKDVKNEIEAIKWTPYDKVQEVIRTTGSSKPRLQFTYDAMGRRVSKKVIRSATDSTQNSVTYYAYDASGNVMGVYEKRYDSQLEYKYTVTEEYIYGSSRVGSYNNGNTVFDSDDETPAYAGTLDRASLRFEITDHLGNVRAVVGGTRTLVDGGGSNLIENPDFDTHSGGLGTDWTWSNNAQGVYSIVTGNGFNGNAQRAEVDTLKTRMVLRSSFTTVAGGQYRISFKYRTNKTFRITGHTGQPNGFTQNNIAVNTGNAITVTYNPTAQGNEMGLYIDLNGKVQGDWIEFDDVEVVRTDVAGETYYLADIKFLGDYYPFGSQMPGRKFVASDGEYRYGFNGKETDEVYGDDNSYDFGSRMYDTRLGRWMSVDHASYVYTSYSPYSYSLNSPIFLQDTDGNVVILSAAFKKRFLKAFRIFKKTDAARQILNTWANSNGDFRASSPGVLSRHTLEFVDDGDIITDVFGGGLTRLFVKNSSGGWDEFDENTSLSKNSTFRLEVAIDKDEQDGYVATILNHEAFLWVNSATEALEKWEKGDISNDELKRQLMGALNSNNYSQIVDPESDLQKAHMDMINQLENQLMPVENGVDLSKPWNHRLAGNNYYTIKSILKALDAMIDEIDSMGRRKGGDAKANKLLRERKADIQERKGRYRKENGLDQYEKKGDL